MSNGNGNNWGGANRVKPGSALSSFPQPLEGTDGDIQVKQTDLGAKIFGKVSGTWYGAPLTATVGNPVTRIGTGLSDHLSIDSDSVDIFKNNAKVATFGEKLIVGQIANDISRLEIDSSGNLKIINRQGTTDTTKVAIDADGTATFTGNIVVGNASTVRTALNVEDGSTSDQSASEIRAGTGWSHSGDLTKIDGGDIYANTITIDELATIANIDLSGKITLTGTDSNVYIGTGQNDLGDENTCIGGNSGASLNANANHNVAIGSYSLTTAAYDSVGGQANWNVAIGQSAGRAITTGYANICIGLAAGGATAGSYTARPTGEVDITTGNGNILIGNLASVDSASAVRRISIGTRSISDGDYGIAIGYLTNATVEAISIGHSITNSTTRTVKFGDAGNSMVSLDWDTGGDSTWVRSSDIRKKRNIKDSNLGLEFINKLRPVTYQWKPQNELPKEWVSYSETNRYDTEKVHIGFIAQELKALIDEYDAPNEIASWSEDPDGMQRAGETKLITPLINAVQELSAKIDTMQTEINNLK